MYSCSNSASSCHVPTYAAIINFLLIVSTTSFAVQLLQSLFFQHVLQQVGTLLRGEQLLQSLNWSGLIYKGCSIFEILGYSILDYYSPQKDITLTLSPSIFMTYAFALPWGSTLFPNTMSWCISPMCTWGCAWKLTCVEWEMKEYDCWSLCNHFI